MESSPWARECGGLPLKARYRLISDGTANGTKIIDLESGTETQLLDKVTWEIDPAGTGISMSTVVQRLPFVEADILIQDIEFAGSSLTIGLTSTETVVRVQDSKQFVGFDWSVFCLKASDYKSDNDPEYMDVVVVHPYNNSVAVLRGCHGSEAMPHQRGTEIYVVKKPGGQPK